jgi:hypothetical protein
MWPLPATTFHGGGRDACVVASIAGSEHSFYARSMKKLVTILLVASFTALGCATSFTGDAHVPEGPAGCEVKCRTWGYELVGMVAMGEYSDGCICRKKGVQLSATETAGAEAAVAGVWMQTQRARHNAAH